VLRDLKDKVVLIAGAATGLGAASARRLAADGARVVVGDLNLGGAEQTAAAITELGGQAVAVQFDIADDASVKDLVSAAMRAYGGWTPRTSTRAR
jgi:NAD(P)-dependent dehydrogenase (short-subunit alcohol dehydrogenase family)